MTSKARITKEKIDKSDFIKIKNFHATKDIINKVKENLQNSRKDLEIIYLIRDLYLEYVKNSYNSKITRNPIL